MSGLVQSVDITAELFTGQSQISETIPVERSLSVTEAEIERAFEASGSTATVTVVFDDLLGSDEETALRKVVDQGVTSTADDPNTVGSREEETDPLKDLSTEAIRESEMKIRIDASVTNMGAGKVNTIESRLFTGTVYKVVESNEREVTFTALDKRHQLNRNMVQLDTTDEPVPVEELLNNILGKQVGFESGPKKDYNIKKINDIRIRGSWGTGTANDTLFSFLRDVARYANLRLYIDEYNTLNITTWPEHLKFRPNTIMPIIEWESGDEENAKHVVVEAPYDGTGLGLYAPISGDVDTSVSEAIDEPSAKYMENNVFSRRALENVRSYEYIEKSLMRDSGIIKTVGDPRWEPYDELILDYDAIDGFAPISQGHYTVKVIRHNFSVSDGYTTSLELGRNTEELFDEFAGQATQQSGIESPPNKWLEVIKEATRAGTPLF